jgi:hypothetical protein
MLQLEQLQRVVQQQNMELQHAHLISKMAGGAISIAKNSPFGTTIGLEPKHNLDTMINYETKIGMRIG